MVTLPAAPESVSCVVHGLRVAAWIVVLELTVNVAVVGLATTGIDVVLWTLLALGVSLACAGLVGFGADRSEWLREHPAVVCVGIATLFMFAAGWPMSRIGPTIVLAPISAFLAWARWRFPGQPSRGRTTFRLVFFGALAVAAVVWVMRSTTPIRYADGTWQQGPNVVVIVLDTVRRDHVTAYGYDRDTTPNIQRLADRGRTWPAWANANWSLPGHATMITGLYAGTHEAHHELGMLTEVPTLQAVLGARGYDTLCITGNPWINEENGLANDFDGFRESWGRYVVPYGFMSLRNLDFVWDTDHDKGGAWGARVFDSWLDERPDADRPFFAFVNVIEAHAPYDQNPDGSFGRFLPDGTTTSDAHVISKAITHNHARGTPPPAASEQEAVTAIYDGAVHSADVVLGHYIDALERSGELDDTLFVVTSDHGEFLGEHELWGHLHGLYEPVLQIPLVIAGPGVEQGHDDAPARLIDITPTVLDLAGVPIESWPEVHGRPLREASTDDVIVAEQHEPRLLTGAGVERVGDLERFDVRRRSWRVGDLKYLTREDNDEQRLHDLAADSTEHALLDDPAALEAARAGLAAWQAETGITWPDGEALENVEDQLDLEALRALGYVH